MLLGIEYSLIPEKPALGKAGWNPGLKSMFNMHASFNLSQYNIV